MAGTFHVELVDGRGESMIRLNSPGTQETMADCASRDWDAIVIGAGPAGTASAITSARAGRRILLVEAKRFPRKKVCGGCLNPAAIKVLEQLLGCEHPFWKTQNRLKHFRIMHRRQRFDVELPTGLAVDRSTLDQILVDAAISEGVTFMEGVTAEVLPAVKAKGSNDDSEKFRSIRLKANGAEAVVPSRCVVVATGLGKQKQMRSKANSVRNSGTAIDACFESVTKRGSRVGVATEVRDDSGSCPTDTIQMAVAKHGYVGITRIDDQSLHVAAAVDLHAIQRYGVKNLTQRILQQAGTHRLNFSDCQWKGTPLLTTRAKQVAGRRIFLVGDAAGYVEPFTGEGIHWALKSGEAVARFVDASCADWNDGLTDLWEAWYAANIAVDQQLCRRIAIGLKIPLVRWVAHQTLRLRPQVAQSIVTRMNRDFSSDVPANMRNAAAASS